MGEHSVFGYLNRMTTRHLDCILGHVLRLEVCEHNAGIIRMILAILREREKNELIEVAPELLDLYERRYGPSE